MVKLFKLSIIVFSILLLIFVALSISCGSTDEDITSTMQLNYFDPYITGKIWNQMKLNQKIRWVDFELEFISIEEDLKEEKLYPAIYYVNILDKVFSRPSNNNALVTWELRVFTE